MINAGTKPDHNRSRSVYLESTHLLRAGWLLVFILLVGLQIAGLPYRYQEALAAPKTSFSSTLDDPAIVTRALTGAGIPLPVYAGYQIFTDILSFIPLGMGISLLRYRLYDFDIILQRTLVYSALTGILVAVYYSSVIIFQQILRVLTDQAGQSSLAIMVSTLGIAALFNPLRRRIQEFIDRRFYRSR